MLISRKKLICFFIMFIGLFFRYLSMWNLISSTTRYMLLPILLIFFIIIIFNKKITKNKIIIIILVVLFGILDFIITNEIDILMSLLIAFAYMFDEGDKLLIKHFLLSSIFFYVLTLILSKLNIISNLNFVRIVNNNIIVRNGLGFSNPNHAFTLLISIIICAYLLFDVEHKKIIFSAIVVIISYLIFVQTNCRTGFYSIIILIIFIFLDNYIKKFATNKIKYLFIIMTLLSFVIAIKFGNSIFFNDLLTNRPLIWNNHISQFPFSFMGYRRAKIDNNYLWLIYKHGFLIYLFYLVINIKATEYFIKNKKMFVSIIIILIYSLFENMVNYAFNIMFILSILYILNNNNFKMFYLNNLEKIGD